MTKLNGVSDTTLNDFYFSTVKDDFSLAETIKFSTAISDAVLANYQVTYLIPLRGIDLPQLGGMEMYYEGEFTDVLE